MNKAYLYSVVLLLGISIISCEQSSNSIAKQNSEIKTPNFYENLTQELFISGNRDTILSGKEGLKISIKENSFVDKNGNLITGNIKVSIKEVLTLEKIIKENISTVTQNGILETRGMLKIEAFQDGEQIMLNKKKSIEIFFPKKFPENKDIKLYYGKENDLGIMEWEIADNEENISRTEKISKRTSIKYRKYKDLDTKNAYLKNNSKAIQFLDSMINFSEQEKQNLWNDYVRIHWLLFDDGDFEILKIEGKISPNKKQEIANKLSKIPYILPFNREGSSYDMTGLIDISFSKNPNYNPDSNYYILNATQLGWINCDIFIEFEAPKIDMLVQGPENSTIKVLFKNYNTIVSGYEKKSGYLFSNIPQNEPIEIIAINYKDYQSPMFSLTKTKVKNAVNLNPLETISINELKLKLDNIN